MQSLLNLLNLEQLDLNLFRSRCHQENHRQILFGGQVLGQALMAAQLTVKDRKPHSLHSYFLRPGTSEVPVIYDVDPIRDGGSFSTRRVVARQKGRAIFNMAISFHQDEEGFEHQVPATPMPPIPTDADLARVKQDVMSLDLPADIIDHMPSNGIIDLIPVGSTPYVGNEITEPKGQFWFRCVDPLPHDSIVQRAALAFASDLGLMATSIFPHPSGVFDPNLMPASLDHAIWFHDDLNINEWLLYDTDSPWAGGARGLNRGSIYSADGRLVASTTQEGLIRRLK